MNEFTFGSVKTDRKRLWILAWFTFTRRERNGILMLSVILLLLQSVLIYQNFILPDIKPVPLTQHEKRIVSSLKLPQPVEQPAHEFKPPSVPIDPNTLNEADWIHYGLSPRQAKVVMNWRQKGGVFRTTHDVSSMKFIPEKVYRQIAPFLVFNTADEPAERKAEYTTTAKITDFKKHHRIIDLNRADTILLQELPMIGAGRARTIWRYRERLGGYYSTAQLREIKFLPDSVLAIILPLVTIQSEVYRKININTLSGDSLYHPYFSRTLLKMIVTYREQHGLYADISVLRSFPLVDEDLWRKIAPYLTTAP